MPYLEDIRNLIDSYPNLVESSNQCYVGKDADSRVQILNESGNNPYIRQITAEEQKSLSLLINYNLESETYRVTLTPIITDNIRYIKTSSSSFSINIIANQQWWISLDNGETIEKVKFLYSQSKLQNTYIRLFLERH